MNKKYIVAAAAVPLLWAGIASAQVSVGVSASAAVNADAPVPSVSSIVPHVPSGQASSSVRADRQASSSAARQADMEKHMGDMQSRGNGEIAARITSLNNLLSRINAMQKVSASTKTSLAATIQTEISALTTLEAAIDADNSTTTLKTNVQSITQAYRIYALVIPQAEIAATSDRVLDIASALDTVAAKIQAQAGGNAAAASALADLALKTADATTQANAAVSATASLQPDQGDATVAASNKAALESARTDLQTAAQDLKAADQDAKTAAKAIKGSASVSASTTTQ
jgi:hypothetical protein